MAQDGTPRGSTDWGSWIHEADSVWPDYHAQAEHLPWPRAVVFNRPETGLFVVGAGGGGGSVQALFRNELLALLERGHEAWLATRAGPSESAERLRAFFGITQEVFEQNRDYPFADHFGATTVEALVGAETVTVASQGSRRAYLYRHSRLTCLTQDDTLRADPTMLDPPAYSIPLSGFSGSRPPAWWRLWSEPVVDQTLRPGDRLLLITHVDALGFSEQQLGTHVTRVLQKTDIPEQAACELGSSLLRGDTADQWRGSFAVTVLRPA